MRKAGNPISIIILSMQICYVSKVTDLYSQNVTDKKKLRNNLLYPHHFMEEEKRSKRL